MKNIFIFITALFMSVSAFAFEVTSKGDNAITGTICDEAGLPYNASFGVNPDEYGSKLVSAVVTYSSVTFANVTFSTDAWTNDTGNITIPAHGLTRAIPVGFSVVVGLVPAPLVTNTTYYIIPISANIVQLATTSVKAQASDYIVMGSSKPIHSGNSLYQLKVPSTIAGTPSYKWQGSNDGVNMFDVAIASVTITGYTNGSITTGFDLSWFNYTNLVLKVISPTTGAIKIKAILNLKPF